MLFPCNADRDSLGNAERPHAADRHVGVCVNQKQEVIGIVSAGDPVTSIMSDQEFIIE
jgi:hypothetical protein